MIKTDYIDNLNSVNQDLKKYYEDINSFEMTHIIPSVRFDTAIFLYQIIKSKNPRNILEIGFGSGTSALFMYKAIDYNIQSFITLERDGNRYIRGKKILNKYQANMITLLKIDAFQYIDEAIKRNTKFDLIFLDAVKRDYIDYLKCIEYLTCKGSVLITDNIFFNEKVFLDDNDLENRYKNGVKLLKNYNKSLSQNKNFTTAFYDIGDGISLSIKILSVILKKK